MSKFVRFTCNGNPRLVSIDWIHMVDIDPTNQRVAIFLSDCTEPWAVDQSLEEVVHAIAEVCEGFYNKLTSIYTDDGICKSCGAYIPTDHRIDYIDPKDVHYCYWCGAIIGGEI